MASSVFDEKYFLQLIQLVKDNCSITSRLESSGEQNNAELKQLMQDILSQLQIKEHDDVFSSGLTLTRKERFHPSPTSSFSSIASEGAVMIKQNTFQDECMSNAILQNIVKMVNTLVFKESEVPDQILEASIATIDECRSLRNLKTPADQISGLVSLVTTKDLSKMNKFLDIVHEQNPEVVQDIRQAYSDMINTESQVSKMPCAVCQLKQKCDIKSVYNHFFAKNQISRGVHGRIVQSKTPIGAQNSLWESLLNELNQHPSCCVIQVLVDALEDHESCNINLIDMLKRLLRKGKPLICSCKGHGGTYQSRDRNSLSPPPRGVPVRVIQSETAPKTPVSVTENADSRASEHNISSSPNTSIKRQFSVAVASSNDISENKKEETDTFNDNHDAAKGNADNTRYKRQKYRDYDNYVLPTSKLNTAYKQSDTLEDSHDIVDVEDTRLKSIDASDSENETKRNTKIKRGRHYDIKKMKALTSEYYNADFNRPED